MIKSIYQYGLGILLLFLLSTLTTFGKEINNKQYNFSITIPASMVEIKDSNNIKDEDLYYDTSAGVVLLISARNSKFKSVSDYIDCSKEGLEHQLQKEYDDTSLILLSCRKPENQANKLTILHFRVSSLPNGYNTYLIYFIHHNHKDIQISFTYNNEREQISRIYIDNIIKTLALRNDD